MLIYKNVITRLTLLILSIIFSGCSVEENRSEYDIIYISNVEVLSHKTSEVKVDNLRGIIELFIESVVDVSAVEIKLTLADNAKLIEPQKATAVYDLNSNPIIRVEKREKTSDFKIIVHFKATPINISSDEWEQKHSFGQLPEYLSVYQFKGDISGKKVKAFIAVADISSGKGTFKILGDKTGYQTPSQFYNKNNKPSVILNGGYFWSGTSLGLLIRDGTTISNAQPVVNRLYQGVQTPYYPTQGAFGMSSDGKFTAQWVYESNNKLYAYPTPSPNKAGEKPYPAPSITFPAGAVEWKPTEAIGAGPLLIKNGEYKNLWENELFDEASGVGPTVNHPRSAIGYHPNGYLVFFVSEGRNKTPDTPGLRLKEVADLLMDIGCTEAINLDGGGSSCMLINGQETIIPSDGKQRSITNAVSVF